MAKLLRHFGLGGKKYHTNSDSLQQDFQKSETNVRQLDAGINGERTHSAIPERKHSRPGLPTYNNGNGATDDQRECASRGRVWTHNVHTHGSVSEFAKTSKNEANPTKELSENGKKQELARRLAFRGKPIATTTPTKEIAEIVLIEDYSDPHDFCPPPLRPPSISSSVTSVSGVSRCPSQEPELLQAEEEDDYSEPFETHNLVQVSPIDGPSSPFAEYEDPDDGAYDAVCGEATSTERRDLLNAGFLPQSPHADGRPGDEYDAPWEWRCPSGSRHLRTSVSSASSAASDLADSLDSVANDGPEATANASTMTGRQRRIYETAFDSTGSSTERLDDGQLEGIQHPRVRVGGTEGGTPSQPPPPLPVPLPRERRKAAPVRDSLRGGCSGSAALSGSGSIGPSPMLKRPVEPLVTRAVVHVPPRSANSTPTLSYRAKEGLDSCASSAKSTPTHFLSRLHHLPLRQLSELTLGEKRNANLLRESTVSMPPIERRTPALVSSEESVASTSSSSGSSTNNNSSASRGSIDNQRTSGGSVDPFDNQREVRLSTGATLTKFQRHLQNLQQQQQQRESNDPGEDSRPSEDYDPPWSDLGRKLKSSSLICDSSSGVANPAPSSGTTALPNVAPRLSLDLHITDEGRNRPVERKQSWASNEAARPNHPPNRPCFQLPLNTDSTTPCRSNLSLNLNPQSPKRRKNNLQLNFGCAALSVLGETVDPTIPLDRQGWYHGTISRIDAENLLRVLQEGCYLVRNSESSKQDYSLSLKSARGFMHMKIVFSDGVYILGQFSKPFNSIPEMIHHYSRNKLPIKGAEHMSLLHPVIDQLL